MQRPPVVILDLEFAGYGIVRSLAPYGIPLIAFCRRRFDPATYSKYLSRIEYFDEDEELLSRLMAVAFETGRKPVLILTSDKYVNFVLEHREKIESNFLIDLPDTSTVEHLMDKVEFYQGAEDQSFLIPKTKVIRTVEDLRIVWDHFDFPVILKPHLRTDAWRKAKFPKVFLFDTFEALIRQFSEIAATEPNLIVQEYIPGEDKNIVFCLKYYDRAGECIGYFSGSKIRQWPPGQGSTAIAVPNDDEQIYLEALKVFGPISYAGFGSIEFKKHEKNGRYYIIEPTVGRVNLQEYVATINGVNLPLIAYNSLTELGIRPQPEMARRFGLILELNELKRRLANTLKGTAFFPKPWGGSFRIRKVYAFIDRKDPLVGIMLMVKLVRVLFRQIRGKIGLGGPV